MEKIFYTTKNTQTTDEILKKLLLTAYKMETQAILRNDNGKPYVLGGPHFSVTHTNKNIYVAISETTIGIDAELLSRKPNTQSIIKKFPLEEQTEILSQKDFLTHWVVKESAVKFLGSTLAKELKKFCFLQGQLSYNNAPFPAKLTLLTHENHIISVCCEKDFSKVTFQKF